MSILPLWVMRLFITLFIFWLIWAYIFAPWLSMTHSFLHTHYRWMLP